MLCAAGAWAAFEGYTGGGAGWWIAAAVLVVIGVVMLCRRPRRDPAHPDGNLVDIVEGVIEVGAKLLD